jgi:uncharacterized protein
MIRNLVLLIVVALGAWFVLREVRRYRERRDRESETKRFAQMVACDHCGTHIPESQAIRVDKRAYCSEAHRRAAENG